MTEDSFPILIVGIVFFLIIGSIFYAFGALHVFVLILFILGIIFWLFYVLGMLPKWMRAKKREEVSSAILNDPSRRGYYFNKLSADITAETVIDPFSRQTVENLSNANQVVITGGDAIVNTDRFRSKVDYSFENRDKKFKEIDIIKDDIDLESNKRVLEYTKSTDNTIYNAEIEKARAEVEKLNAESFAIRCKAEVEKANNPSFEDKINIIMKLSKEYKINLEKDEFISLIYGISSGNYEEFINLQKAKEDLKQKKQDTAKREDNLSEERSRKERRDDL